MKGDISSDDEHDKFRAEIYVRSMISLLDL